MSRRNYQHSADSFLNAVGTTTQPIVTRTILPATNPVAPISSISADTVTRTQLSPTTTSIGDVGALPVPKTTLVDYTPIPTPIPTPTNTATIVPVVIPVVTAPILSDVINATQSVGGFGGGGGGFGGGGSSSSKAVDKSGVIESPSFIKRNWIPLLLTAVSIYVFIKKPIK